MREGGRLPWSAGHCWLRGACLYPKGQSVWPPLCLRWWRSLGSESTPPGRLVSLGLLLSGRGGHARARSKPSTQPPGLGFCVSGQGLSVPRRPQLEGGQ